MLVDVELPGLSGNAAVYQLRSQGYKGRIVTVSEAFRDGEGRVLVGDSPWLASGPDLPLGATAKIVGADGSRLVVAAVDE